MSHTDQQVFILALRNYAREFKDSDAYGGTLSEQNEGGQ
jgi:hypothetical protein